MKDASNHLSDNASTLPAAGPALIISDWMMPDLDELEFCRRIRAEPRADYTYIVPCVPGFTAIGRLMHVVPELP